MRCSLKIAGSGTASGGEAIITGTVVYKDGSAVNRAHVYVRPFDYYTDNHYKNISESINIRIADLLTDQSGSFSVDSLDSGKYIVEVNDGVSQGILLFYTIPTVKTGTGDIQKDTLQPLGTMSGTIASGNSETLSDDVYIQIRGLERITKVDRSTGSFTFTDIPKGTFSLRIFSFVDLYKTDSVTTISVNPAEQTYIGTVVLESTPYSKWQYSKSLYCNTTPSGADVSSNVYDFPILIRLTERNFNFSQANSNGSDIRFSKINGTTLPYEIERWDAANKQAEIWVKLDTVYGNSNIQYFRMFWGNVNAINASNSSAVFDTIAGFQGVWHLGEPGATAAIDATANGYHGTPYNISSSSTVAGKIGLCKKFSGDSSFFSMNGTANSKLNFQKDGIYSISAWVYTDTFDLKKHSIVSKGDNQYSLGLMDSNEWEFSEYKNLSGWEATRSKAEIKTWTHVAGVRIGTKQYLYINGICTNSSFEIYPDTDLRNTGFDVMIGRTKSPTDKYPLFFKGSIDEVRITNKTPQQDWFKLCYMNQKEEDGLVIFK